MLAFRLLIPLMAIATATTDTFAKDNPLELSTMSTSSVSSKLAAEIHFRARIGKPASGHEYRFEYQLRLHTKMGEEGPLLGSSAHPNGTAFDLGLLVKPTSAGWAYQTPSAPAPSKSTVDEAAKTLEFDGYVDVTRKELSGMTNLPKNARNSIVRVEPQIYDATDKKFVTVPKTNAVLLFVETGPTGQVWAVRPFQDWFPQQFGSMESAEAALRVLEEVDAWDGHQASVEAFERALADPDTKPALKALAVRGLPSQLIYSKNALPGLLAAMAKSDDADLKAAAVARLGGAAQK